MSWSGFKKNVGRATTQVMMKTGHVERTNDRTYEVEERRYRTLESAANRLQKEAKGYLDSLRAMTASQMRIAETIDAFYGEAGANDGVSRSYKQAVEDLDAETIKALDGPYRSVSPNNFDTPLLRSPDGELATIEDEAEIEYDLNYAPRARMRRRMQKAEIYKREEGNNELIDDVYRQTILEPINRFCAYFPDINECIKKRNHKMLDYDSMRSKVKRLTEKPDKDPGKLPRTEKETEMVTANQFLLEPLDEEEEVDLRMLSPPKRNTRVSFAPEPLPSFSASKAKPAALDLTSEGTKIVDRDLRRMSGSPRILQSWASFRSHTMRRSYSAAATQRSGSPISTTRLSTSFANGDILDYQPGPLRRVPSTEAFLKRLSEMPTPPELAEFSMKAGATRRWSLVPSLPSHGKKRISMASFTPSFFSTRPSPDTHLPNNKTRNASGLSKRTLLRTPFMNPSELEDLMAPLREDYMKNQTDMLAQAKEAYEQLNKQLTDEIPQLIDLRVPYLDPSFEALVKIQLRFCAEAYSRMAQVQQYLEASTRDQYANGDLDARVEDVLGQIRELSIAGTV
ncbi:hypothetical protein MBLNU230_g2227t1 [Neophaeotheca triangularis]